MHIPHRRSAIAAGATTLTLLAGGLFAPAQAAGPYDPAPTADGASWLSDQVTKGLVHNEQFDFDDVGLSIDVALGLDAAGKKPSVVKAITKAVAKNVGFYTAFPPSVYAGATAKAAVLALEQGKNPRSFGGVDLVTQLEGRVATAAPITGRIEDAYDPGDPFGGDYANVIGQAYAASALSQAKSPKAASAASFLIQQQCAKGYFRQSFTADKSRADQSCQGAPAAERGSSTDATALAILALQDVKGAKAKAAVKKAVTWLVDRQRDNGAFSDTGKSSGAYNSNSTGLAGWALGEAGSAKQAAKAAVWVRNLQVPRTNPCAGKLAKQTGAIAYDDNAYGTGQGVGIKKKDGDQWRRASAQALPVLRWAPRAEGEFTATPPPTAVEAGNSIRIRLTGVAPGERVCVSGNGTIYDFEAGRHPTSVVSFVAPHLTSTSPLTHTYHVWLGSMHRDVVVRVTDSGA
jgi:hypothetical protein